MGYLTFSGIVVDEVRITASDFYMYFDAFQGSTDVGPTTTVSTASLSADTGASTSDFITKTATQTISGTLSANLASGESVEVSFDNGGTWGNATTFTVGSSSWSTTTTLAGSDTFQARVTNNDGSSAAFSHSYTLDTTAPTTTIATIALSADTGASSTDFITKTAAQTISGTLSANVAAGETVYVSLDNGSTWTAATTTVGQNTWSLAGQTLTASNTLKVKVSDTAGNDGTVASQAYTLDTTAPTTTIATMAFSADTGASSTDFITTTAAQTISGTLSANVAAGETVYVSLDNGSTWTAATTTVGQNTWSLAGQTLTASNTLKVKVSDTAGNDGTVASQAYTLDTTAPATTIATMAFSADTGASSTDFITKTAAQTISGTLSANVAAGETVYVSLDNGSTWTAATTTVGQNTWSLAGQTLTASNTLKVKVSDTAGNDGTVASQAYTLDTTAPTTTIATMAFSADTGASSTDFITTTAAQTISGTLSANVAAGETVYVSLDNGSTWTAATTTVGQNTWSLAGQTLTASDTLKAKVTDAAGNDGTTASQAYVFTTGAPIVTTVSVVDGTYADGQDLDLTVTFDASLVIDTSGGTPRLALTVGSATRYATYLSGSGSATLIFRYTVQTGDGDADGVAVGSSIDANGGTMQDTAGNDADLTINGLGSTSGVLVDGVAPTASSLVRASTSPSNATSVVYTLTFDEDVTGVDLTDFTLSSTGSATGSITSVVATSADVYSITVGSITGVGSLRVDLNASLTGIADLAGNPVSGGATGATYDIDSDAPAVTSVAVPTDGTYTQGETLRFTVTFDEAVTVAGAPQLTLTVGSATRAAAYVSGSGSANLVFGYDIQSGELDEDGVALATSIDLNSGSLRDAAGNDAVLTLHGISSTSNVWVDGRLDDGGRPDDPWYKDSKSSCGMGSGSALGMIAGLFMCFRLRRPRR